MQIFPFNSKLKALFIQLIKHNFDLPVYPLGRCLFWSFRFSALVECSIILLLHLCINVSNGFQNPPQVFPHRPLATSQRVHTRLFGSQPMTFNLGLTTISPLQNNILATVMVQTWVCANCNWTAHCKQMLKKCFIF